jgi:hypothetical protein
MPEEAKREVAVNTNEEKGVLWILLELSQLVVEVVLSFLI